MNKLIALFLLITTPVFAQPKIQEVKTDIGITALLVENKTNPIISVNVAFITGSVHDGLKKQGLSDLYAELLGLGAGDYSAEEFQQKLYEQSINLGFSAGPEEFDIKLQTLRKNYETAFALLRDSIEHPSLPKTELEIAKKQMLAALKIKKEQPKNEIFSRFKSFVFGDHPYGYGDKETEKYIQSITRDDLVKYKNRFAKDNILIGVSGDISAVELKQVLEKTFSFLPEKSDQIEIPAVHFHKKGEMKFAWVKNDSQQMALMFSFPWITRQDEDFFAGYLLNYILGGSGLDSVLSQEIREKRGLTYSIGTFLLEYENASMLAGISVRENHRIDEFFDEIKKVIYNFKATQTQLDNAKSYLIGAFPMTFASTMSTASLLVVIQHYNLGLDYLEKRNDYINAVTLDDVNNFAKQYLDLNKSYFIFK